MVSKDIQLLTLPNNDSEQPTATVPSIVMTLLPIMAAVFVGFLVTGMAMPVLPLHVHLRLASIGLA